MIRIRQEEEGLKYQIWYEGDKEPWFDLRGDMYRVSGEDEEWFMLTIARGLLPQLAIIKGGKLIIEYWEPTNAGR
jgi:hypothetical protein